SICTLPLCVSTLFPYTTLFRSYRKPRWVMQDVPLQPVGERSIRHRREGVQKYAPHLLVAARRDVPALAHVASDKHQTFLQLHRRSEEHTSELQSRENLVCRLLL